MEIPVFSSIRGSGTEKHTDVSYFWSNFQRSKDDRLVIQLTLAGTCFHENERGRRLVEKGQAMLFTYNEPSAYGYPPAAIDPYELSWMNILPSSCILPVFEKVRKDFGPLIRMEESGEARGVFDELTERDHSQSFRDPLQESELLSRLFHCIYREQLTGGRRPDDPISRGYQMIQNRYRTAMNMKTVADHCGVSREHFVRRFQERYGVSPATLLRQLRLKHGREALMFSHLSVDAIAHLTGFTSANSFCRAFRKEYGKSPLEERAAGATDKR